MTFPASGFGNDVQAEVTSNLVVEITLTALSYHNFFPSLADNAMSVAGAMSIQ